MEELNQKYGVGECINMRNKIFDNPSSDLFTDKHRHFVSQIYTRKHLISCGEKVGESLGCSKINLKEGCKWQWNCCGKYGIGAPGCYKICVVCQLPVNKPGCCKIAPLKPSDHSNKNILTNDNCNQTEIANSQRIITMDQLKELYSY